MKKAFSIFLALVFIFALTGTAIAEDNVPTFVISEATAAPGDEVRVTISIQNNTEVASIQLEPQYDHDVLEWTDVEQGDYTGTWNPRVDKGFVNWFGINGHNVSNDGVFATLVFKVSENAAAGDYVVTVTYDEDNVFDEDEENVYFDITPGKVTVTEPETIADGYYLIGLNGWTVDTLTAADKFVENEGASGEYMLDKELAVNDEFKAVKVENGAIADNAWYPVGMGNNYVVDEDHAGSVTIYFRPNYDGGNDWYYNCLYVRVKPAFMTQSLVLEGDIGVRFYVRLPEDLRNENTSVSFTIDCKDGESYASTVSYIEGMPTNSKGYYGFTFYVNTIQMADTITATLKNGEGETLDEKTYSVKTYFTTFDNHQSSFSEDVGNLVKATADLGHYMQAYLDESRDSWSVEDGDHTEMDKFYATYTESDFAETIEAVAEHEIKITANDNSGIRGLAYKVNFERSMSIQLDVTMPKNYSGTVTATADGDACKITQVEGTTKYMVEISNVYSHQLSHIYEIVVTTSTGTLTLKGSALSFVNMMLAGAEEYDNSVMQNAAIAVYQYSKFADIVKGNPNNPGEVDK